MVEFLAFLLGSLGLVLFLRRFHLFLVVSEETSGNGLNMLMRSKNAVRILD